MSDLQVLVILTIPIIIQIVFIKDKLNRRIHHTETSFMIIFNFWVNGIMMMLNPHHHPRDIVVAIFTTSITNMFVRDKLNPHHHHPRDKLTERKRYLSKSREAIFEKVTHFINKI